MIMMMMMTMMMIGHFGDESFQAITWNVSDNSKNGKKYTK